MNVYTKQKLNRCSLETNSSFLVKWMEEARVLYKDTCIPGANMMQDTTRVNNNSRPYITLEAVEF